MLVLIRLDIVFFFLDVAGMNRATSVCDFGFLPRGCTAFECLLSSSELWRRAYRKPLFASAVCFGPDKSAMLPSAYNSIVGTNDEFFRVDLLRRIRDFHGGRRLTFPGGTGIVK